MHLLGNGGSGGQFVVGRREQGDMGHEAESSEPFPEQLPSGEWKSLDGLECGGQWSSRSLCDDTKETAMDAGAGSPKSKQEVTFSTGWRTASSPRRGEKEGTGGGSVLGRLLTATWMEPWSSHLGLCWKSCHLGHLERYVLGTLHLCYSCVRYVAAGFR